MKCVWILTFMAVAATGVCGALGLSAGWCVASAAVAVALLSWLWVKVVLPARKVAVGIELLKGNELNNRLAPSHEPGTDRIVKVFNGLLDQLSEERLRLLETNHLLELLVKASPMGVAIMDFDCRFTLVNDAFCSIAGIPAEDLIGHVPSDTGSRLLRSVADMADREERTLQGSDTEIYRVSRLSFMERGFRRPFMLIERLTDEIRQAEKEAYGKVVRTISHEVNNTLGGFSSLLQSLSEDDTVDADLRELAVSCLDSCDNLTRFIGGYADVVRLGSPHLEPIDYNAQLRRELPFLRSLAGEGIAVETDLCEGPLPLHADSAMLRQVMVNVVKNAAESLREKFPSGQSAEERPVIRIVTRRTPQGFAVEVIDNGAGIPETVAARLFSPFHTTKPNGQGLGLTLTAEILRRHGYRFSLTTLSSDRLTTFRFTS